MSSSVEERPAAAGTRASFAAATSFAGRGGLYSGSTDGMRKMAIRPWLRPTARWRPSGLKRAAAMRRRPGRQRRGSRAPSPAAKRPRGALCRRTMSWQPTSRSGETHSPRMCPAWPGQDAFLFRFDGPEVEGRARGLAHAGQGPSIGAEGQVGKERAAPEGMSRMAADRIDPGCTVASFPPDARNRPSGL